MRELSLLLVASALGELAVLVWRANPRRQPNKLFAIHTVFVCLWVLGVAGLQAVVEFPLASQPARVDA